MNNLSWNNQRGAALPEVIIALLILVSGSIAALTLMDSILKLAYSSNSRLIATNLAREGLEGMRSIRDSNWLLYSGSQHDTSDQTRDHWNDGFDCTTIFPAACPDPFVARFRVFLKRDIDDRLFWSTDYSEALPEYQSDDPATIVSNDYYRLILDENIDLSSTISVYNAGPDALGTQTPFYRQIKVSYIDSYDGQGTPGQGDVNDNLIFVQSRVFWKEGTAVQEVALETIMSDWYGRDNHL